MFFCKSEVHNAYKLDAYIKNGVLCQFLWCSYKSKIPVFFLILTEFIFINQAYLRNFAE